MIKAACGDTTSFTMTPNTPWRTVGFLLLKGEWKKNGGTNAKEERNNNQKTKQKKNKIRR